MNRREFGKLIQTLRKEQTIPNKAGHLKTVTQKDLAAQSGLTVSLIRKLEGGKLQYFTQDILVRLAEALNLTNRERQEFFLAAAGVDKVNLARQTTTDEADQILAKLSEALAVAQVPGLIVDTYLDIIAVNHIFLHIYEARDIDLAAMAAVPPQGFNLLKLIFAPQLETYRQGWTSSEQWRNIAYRNLIAFRERTLRYRITDYFGYLLAQLRVNETFDRLWRDVIYEKEKYFLGNKQTQILFQKEGLPLTYFVTAETVPTRHGNLEFMTYVPTTPETALAFHDIAQKAGSGIRRLNSDWPAKSVSGQN